MTSSNGDDLPLSFHQPLFEPKLVIKDPTDLDKLKDMVWAVKIKGFRKYVDTEVHGTAFCLKSDGLLMSCAHLFSNMSITEIRVRKLNENEFKYEAKIECMKLKWDVALLRVQGVSDCGFGVLADDGSLYETENLLLLGTPYRLTGSVLVGRVAHRCVNDVLLPTDSRTCGTYDSNVRALAPPYRVLGDVIDRVTLHPSKNGTKWEFEKHLHPMIPVIQCVGFVSGDGCSGGPMFNAGGKIVGMLIMGFGGYEFAVHVTLLKKFFHDALKEREEGGNDVKDLKRKLSPDPPDEDTSKRAKEKPIEQKRKGKAKDVRGKTHSDTSDKCGTGGPLINRFGEVIGIITFYDTHFTPFIPINVACKWWEHYKKNGILSCRSLRELDRSLITIIRETRRLWLGMEVTNFYAAELHIIEKITQKFPNVFKGLIVEEVMPGSSADSVGICPNDVIVQCGGKTVRSFLEFFEVMWDKAMDPVELIVIRESADDPLHVTMVDVAPTPDVPSPT